MSYQQDFLAIVGAILLALPIAGCAAEAEAGDVAGWNGRVCAFKFDGQRCITWDGPSNNGGLQCRDDPDEG